MLLTVLEQASYRPPPRDMAIYTDSLGACLMQVLEQASATSTPWLYSTFRRGFYPSSILHRGHSKLAVHAGTGGLVFEPRLVSINSTQAHMCRLPWPTYHS